MTTENASPKKIVALCEQHWEKNKANCSGFVKDVAADLNVVLTGQANDIVDQIQKGPWTTLATGVDAANRAAGGSLVVAGLKASGNGHVVIIVPGTLAHGKYPLGYWGRLNSEGEKNKHINWSWNKTDRDKVIYSSRVLA